VTALVGQFAALFAAMLALFAALAVGVTIVSRWIGEVRLRNWLGGGAVAAPVKGLVVGVLTPFCSWSTVPVLLGLLRARVRTSAVAAFYLASPILDPILIAVLAVLFGVRIAVAFTVVITVGTVAGAILAERLGVERHILQRVRVLAGSGCDEPADAPWGGWRVEARQAVETAGRQLRLLAGPLALASAVGVLIAAAVSPEAVAGFAGPDQAFAVPAAALLGVPVYLPTEALAPLGWALREVGVSTGAIFALVITAAGLSIPEFALLSAIVRVRLIVGLIVLVTVIAIIGGLLIPWLA
jgi:uncharacterized protein